MIEMNRREFVAGTAAMCAGMLSGVKWTYASETEGPVDAGEIKDYASDGVYDAFAEKHRFFIVRRDNRLYAVSNICSHKRFSLEVNKDDRAQIKCAKHGSLFDPAGLVTKGPAKNPLPRHAIRLNEQKRIMVDPTKLFESKEWDSPGASIEV